MRVEPSTPEVMREALARVEVVARAFQWTPEDRAAARALAQRRPALLLRSLAVWSKVQPGPDAEVRVGFSMDCPVCGRPFVACGGSCQGGAA